MIFERFRGVLEPGTGQALGFVNFVDYAEDRNCLDVESTNCLGRTP